MEPNELTPEYVLQPHAISRAVYRLSATARKIIAMGMAILPSDLSNLTVSFSIFDYCTSLGIEPSGEIYQLVQNAVRECIRAEITIQIDKDWEMFTWLSRAWYTDKNKLLTLEFSKGLADYLLTLKKMYARLDLMDFGKIQSLYAIRYFELAKSYESLRGKNGNRQNHWYFDRTIEDLRKILGITAENYKLTKDFRIYIIERPIKELNNANLGLKITLEYIRKGKFLVSVRFLCEKIPIKLQSRNKKSVKNIEIPEKSPETLEDKEAEHLKKLYPEEYAQLYAERIKSPPNSFFRDMPQQWQKRVDFEVCKILREKHGIRL